MEITGARAFILRVISTVAVDVSWTFTGGRTIILRVIRTVGVCILL